MEKGRGPDLGINRDCTYGRRRRLLGADEILATVRRAIHQLIQQESPDEENNFDTAELYTEKIREDVAKEIAGRGAVHNFLNPTIPSVKSICP